MVSFWNETASWRAEYFARLCEADPTTLIPPLRLQREFVIEENQVIASEVKSAETVVDLGCGVGRSLLPGIRAHPEKFFLGIDLSERQIEEFAGVLAKEGHENARAVLGDARHMPLPSGWADLVMVCNQTFGTILGSMREEVMCEIGRVLRHNGRLYVGGFDNIQLAASLYRAWGVPIVSVEPASQFVTLGDYNSWWQDAEDLTTMLDSLGFRLLKGRRVGLGYLNTYTYSPI